MFATSDGIAEQIQLDKTGVAWKPPALAELCCKLKTVPTSMDKVVLDRLGQFGFLTPLRSRRR